MNELTTREHALELHSRIKMYAARVQDSIYNIGKCMAEMRDRALYKELEYDTFEEYSREEFNLGNTQASKFISVYRNLGEEYIKSNAQLGISKLYLLSQLAEEDREEIETEAVDCSFSELQKKIKELEAEKEKMQLSMFDLETKNKELQERPVEVAVKEDNSEEIENIKAGYEKKIANSEEKLAKAEEKLAELEKKLEGRENTHVNSAPAPATADNETVFTMLVKNLVSNLNQFADFLDGISETDEKELYKGKVVSVLEKIKAKF